MKEALPDAVTVKLFTVTVMKCVDFMEKKKIWDMEFTCDNLSCSLGNFIVTLHWMTCSKLKLHRVRSWHGMTCYLQSADVLFGIQIIVKKTSNYKYSI